MGSCGLVECWHCPALIFVVVFVLYFLGVLNVEVLSPSVNIRDV